MGKENSETSMPRYKYVRITWHVKVVMKNTLEMNEKIESLNKKQKIEEEPNGKYRTGRYNNQNLKITGWGP